MTVAEGTYEQEEAQGVLKTGVCVCVCGLVDWLVGGAGIKE